MKRWFPSSRAISLTVTLSRSSPGKEPEAKRGEGGSGRSNLEWYFATRPGVVVATWADILEWLCSAGVPIPEETGVAVVDVSAVAEPCAGIDQRGYAVGVAAMDMLTGQLYRNERGTPEQPRTNLLEGSWVDGPTVRRVR